MQTFWRRPDFHIHNCIFLRLPSKYYCRAGERFLEHVDLLNKLIHVERFAVGVFVCAWTSSQNDFMAREKGAETKLDGDEARLKTEMRSSTNANSTM